MNIDKITNLPNYSIKEVSHLLNMPPSTIRSWTKGQSNFKPLIKIAQTSPAILSFNNLVEVFIMHAITRRNKLPMRNLRIGLVNAMKKFKSKRPLLEKDFATDGISLFLTEEFATYDISNKAGQIILDDYLFDLKRIDRNDLGLPIRIYPHTRIGEPEEPKAIKIDPLISFGRPVLSNSSTPVDVIAERFKAGDDPDFLALDFNIPKHDVLEAIRFELELQKAA